MDISDMDMQNMPGMDMSKPSMQNMPGMDVSKPSTQSMPGMDMSKPSTQSMPAMDMPKLKGIDDGKTQVAPQDSSASKLRHDARLEFNVLGDPNDSQPPLSLADLQKLATDHNPTLVQARSQVEGELGKAKQAGLYLNPSLAYNGDLMGLPGAGAGEWQGGLVSQEVVLGSKLKLSREKYLARAEAAKQQLRAQSLRVSNDVQAHYYHVLASVQRLKMQNELFKSMRDQWLTVHEMSNLGEANEADKHLANANQAEQRLHVQEAENELMYAWENLVTVLGIELPYRRLAGNLEGQPQMIPWQNLVDRLVKDSPQLGEAKAKLRSDEITVKREKRQKIPDVVLTGGAGYDQLDQGFAARANLAIVNIPLFDRNQGTVQQAVADLNRQKAQVQLVELQLRRELARQYREYATAVQHIDVYGSTIIPELQKRYEVMLKSYMDTRTDWPSVLETQRDFFNARLTFVSHLETWREREISLNGFLLTGALEAPPGVTPPGHIDATPKPR